MENKFTVLGYKKNPVLQKYREYQYTKLLKILESNISSQEYALFQEKGEEKCSKFLFHPDQASILLCLEFIDDPDSALGKFHEELKKFLSDDSDALTMNSGLNINGTNINLSIQDNNPLNSYDAHPDSTDKGGKLGWGVQSPEEWREVYENTFELLKKIDEDFFDELNYMIQKIVPFGTAKHIHYSASYKECVGTLYMGYTLGTDIPELHVLEGLVHESTHNKLNLIMQHEDIIINDFQEKYYSPYRPDARHMYGVFLGIHALIPTVYILLKGVKKGLITDNRWLEKIVLYHMKNKIGISTMKKFGILTEIGNQVYRDLIEVSQFSDVWVKEIIKEYNLPISHIQQKAKEHFLDVSKNYPYLQY